MACGIFISSVKFSGQTCQVTFLDASDNLTYQLGDETIPFTYYPPDNSPQGTYFIYFSGTDTTYPLVVSGACPTPTPTLTPTNTPTPTVTTGLTPTATETPTVTPTPTITKTSGIYNALFTSGSTIYNSCYSNNTVRLYFVEPFYTPFQNAYLNSNFTTFAPVGYYTNSGIVYYYNGFDLESQGACPSVTPTSTLTPTPTVTIGLTPTATETLTPTQTVTPTNTVTPSVTPTNTITPTVTPTNTITPTVTASVTPSNTATNTQTPTVTPTKTTTPTKTNTPTPSPTKNYTGCQYYQLSNDSSLGNVIYSYIDCNGGLITGNILPPNPDILLCARKNSVIRTGGVNSLIITDLGLCPSPTPTNTPTNTVTPTNTPTIPPSPTPTGTIGITQTPTPTLTPTPTPIPFVPGAFTFDADYIVLTYSFTDGVDLDTRTKVTVPNIGQTAFTDSIGYCCKDFWPESGTPILTWGGDNTGTGFESVLINLIEFKSQYSGSTTIVLNSKAFWYGSLGTNPVTIQVTLYKGGTMVPDPDNYTFINNTFTAAYGALSPGNTVTTNESNCIEGDNITSLQYNLVTYNGQFI